MFLFANHLVGKGVKTIEETAETPEHNGEGKTISFWMGMWYVEGVGVVKCIAEHSHTRCIMLDRHWKWQTLSLGKKQFSIPNI